MTRENERYVGGLKLAANAETTAWFTFGQVHVHSISGRTFDKDCVVEITDKDPREFMFAMFGRKWAFEYDQPPDMRHFRRGIIQLQRFKTT